MSKLIEGRTITVDGVMFWANAERTASGWLIYVHASIKALPTSDLGAEGSSVSQAFARLRTLMCDSETNYEWVGYQPPRLLARALHASLVEAQRA